MPVKNIVMFLLLIVLKHLVFVFEGIILFNHQKHSNYKKKILQKSKSTENKDDIYDEVDLLYCLNDSTYNSQFHSKIANNAYDG